MARSPGGRPGRGPVTELPLRLGANARGGLRQLVAWRLLGGETRPWLVLRLGPETRESATPGWWWVSSSGQHRIGPPLLDALRVLEAAGRDRRLGGVLLRFAGPVQGWGKALALRRAVERARSAGLRVAAWGESYSAEDYLVASAAERVWLPPSGQLFLVGVRTDHFFVKGLLDHLDVRPEVIRVGGYKTAGEMLVREGMSSEQREQIGAWLDDVHAELVDAVGRGRGLSPEEVTARIDGGPYSSEAAVESGLVDASVYPDEIDEALEDLGAERRIWPRAGGERRVAFVDAADYAALVANEPGWRPLLGDLPRVVYAVARGTIRRSDGRSLAGVGIDGEGWRALLAELALRPEVRAVVLRIDSPGGDAVASDLLHRAVSRLAARKPVVVSMGDVAASGGYYVSAAAHAIHAEALTLTGSIGVVGGKLDLEGFYRRIGVSHESLERGARAGMLSEARGFRPDERNALRRGMEALYETFVERVAEGRGLEPEAVRRLGGGRVWSGRGALRGGLVDRLGGPLEAIADALRRAGIAEGERYLLELHPRRPRWLDFRSLLGGWLLGE